MNRSRFNYSAPKTLVRRALSVAVAFLAIFTIASFAAAQDAQSSTQDRNPQVVSASFTDEARYQASLRSLDDDGLDPHLLLAHQGWATTCYTFAGPSCPLMVLLPPGAPCACYPGGLPGVAGY
jgi:hypothetical protein